MLTLAQMICGIMRGHEDVAQRADGRIWLRCTLCSRETPGWSQARVPIKPSRPMSHAEAQELHAELLDLEMSLAGGG